jgi:hypothetical protein
MHLVEKETFIDLKEKINKYKETVRKTYKLTNRQIERHINRQKERKAIIIKCMHLVEKVPQKKK